MKRTQERPFGPQHPQYLSMVLQPLFELDDETPRETDEPVQGFDVAWGGDIEDPEISFIVATEVRRDYGGTMLLFAYEGTPSGLWIGCDTILWMRPATRSIPKEQREAMYRSRFTDPPFPNRVDPDDPEQE